MTDSQQRGISYSGASRDSRADQSFEIKGSVFTLSVLHLFTSDIQAVERNLAARPAKTAAFFRNAPVMIDLQALPESATPDLDALVQVLRTHHFIPVGVRHARPAQESAAVAAGLGVLPSGRPGRESSTGESRTGESRREEQRLGESKPAEAPQEPTPSHASKTVVHPVRSGQQIYAQGGDLTVLGAVSPGAEILADGHIHVYGPLRGRALAGVKGNVSARIFCQSLEAELVSVAGHYRVIENPGEAVWGRPAQVYLAENRLIIESL